jgi:hypothetical protein
MERNNHYFCFFRRRPDWEKIDLVKQLINQLKASDVKFCDEYVIGIDKINEEIKSAWFKNPSANFIGQIKIMFDIDLKRCESSTPSFHVE